MPQSEWVLSVEQIQISIIEKSFLSQNKQENDVDQRNGSRLQLVKI